MLLIFDLDDTLIDSWNYSIPFKLRLVAKKLVELGVAESEETAFSGLMEQNKTAQNSGEAVKSYISLLDVTGEREERVEQEAIKVLDGVAQNPESIPLLKGAEELLNWAAQTNQLAIVTHGVEEEQRRKVNDLTLDPALFKAIVVSPTYDKTGPYEQVCDELGFREKDVLVVGDKYKTDLLPAKRLGMRTVHIKWGRGRILLPMQGEVDFVIEQLSELKDIIRNLEDNSNNLGAEQ